MKKINLLLVFNNLDAVNGITHYWKSFIENLAENNDFRLFILSAKLPEIYFNSPNIKFIINNNFDYSNRSIFNIFKAIILANNTIRNNNINIIHVNHFYHALIFRVAKLFSNVKIIQTIHGIISSKGILPHYFANQYIAVANHIFNLLKLKLDNVSLIYANFNKSRFKNFTENNNIKFLVATRFSEEKGMHILTESIKILKKQNINYNISIAGEGELQDEIISFCKSYEINFLGKEYDIDNLLHNYDVLINPIIGEREIEGFPTVLIYAALKHLLVISSDFVGHDLILNRNNSLIYDKNNPNELASNIIYSINNFSQSNKMREQSKKDFEDIFCNNLSFKKLTDIYKN